MSGEDEKHSSLAPPPPPPLSPNLLPPGLGSGGGKPKSIKLHSDRNYIERLTYGWTRPIVDRAENSLLRAEDLGIPPTWLETGHSCDRFLHFWRIGKKDGRSWTWILYRFLRRDILTSAINSLVSDVFLWLQAPLFNSLVRGLAAKQAGTPSTTTWMLYVYAGLMLIVFMIRLLLLNYCTGKVFDMGYVSRAAIMGAVYRSALSFSSGPRQKYCGGKGINIITTDANRICSTMTLVNFTWIIPIRIVTAFSFAYYYLGLYALPAMLFVLLVIPTLYLMARLLKTRRNHLATTIDTRMGLTQESLQNIRVVKYLALEENCASRIGLARQRELNLLFSANSLLALAGAIDFWAPIFAATLSIATMALYAPTLQPGVVFAFIQTFSALTVPLWVLPLLVGGFVTSKVAAKRIDSILMTEQVISPQPCNVFNGKREEGLPLHIRVEQGNFQWEALPPDLKKKKKRRVQVDMDCSIDPQKLFALQGIDLLVPRGSLVAVIGRTGAGKTSLLSALLGEMRLRHGIRTVTGSIGLCQQNVWLSQGTVRENILFGLLYDEERYRKVLQQCALEIDLAAFPAGDQTMIGERGTTVSGGQRQRIGLARVAYALPDIAFLDDPLSAVDANVGQCLFYDCIKNGILSQSTRILTTHHTGFLSDCDLIVAMDEGRIIAVGTFTELIQSTNPDHASVRELLLKSPVNSKENRGENLKHVEEDPCSQSQELNKYKEDVSRSAGREAIKTYLRVFGGWGPVLLLAFLAIATEVCKVAREYFLKERIQTKITQGQLSFSLFYASLGTIQGLLSASVSILAVWLCKRASKKIHNECLGRVLAAKLSIFDVTPIGRVLNRFGRDLDTIDTNFPDRVTQLLICMSALVSAVLLITFYCPKALPSILIPLFVTLWLQQKFRRAWRQLQQLSGITLGPIVSHFTESLAGLSTIRAFRQEEHFIAKFDSLNDIYAYTSIWLMSVRRWASLRTEAVWIVYLVSLAVLCVWLDLKAEITGLVLMYVMHTVESVDWSMRHLAELESCFVSVERLHQYIMGLETENEYCVKEGYGGERPQNWPAEGRVEFQNVTIRYKPELQPTIDNFSFVFEPRKRVAIVGRSGAGKSTIVGALFRFINLSKGVILIDGIDISTLPLRTLRRSLAMVPQDPVLFSGTLRSNLDPDDRLHDDVLWFALDSVKMRCAVQEHPRKLEMPIDEAGAGFSIGQRQLLCLARAVLRGSRIIVLDEATSNLDRETEALMQASLDETFRGSTLITIAHRLETILNHDTVIVMGRGRILEVGSPRELANAKGEFAKMLKAASVSTIQFCGKV